jgi:chorismate lyase/3-hydroxybenzoate synthase
MVRLSTSTAMTSYLGVRAWETPNSPGVLAAITSQAAAQKQHNACILPLPSLGGTSRIEYWRTPDGAFVVECPPLILHQSGDWLFGVLALPEKAGANQFESCIEAAYKQIMQENNERGYPHLLRVWNYFAAINQGQGDDERYRRFCTARARIISNKPETGYAAATVIGIPELPSMIHIHWLASKTPGMPIDNPRQVNAWEYPREYGNVPPLFSRAMLVNTMQKPLLLVSGTASILGHESKHHDVIAQLDETLNNLNIVIEAAARKTGTQSQLSEKSLLRVYLRNAQDAPQVLRYLQERIGVNATFMLLQGDICRTNLLVEIELVQPLA